MCARAKEAFRPLTDQEALFFRRLFEIGSDDLRSFEAQLQGISARRSCSCGCPSIELAISDSATLGKDRGERIVGDFAGHTVDRSPVGILIFQENGKLAELEVYSMDDLGEFGLPLLESVQVLEWEPSPHDPNVRIPRSPESPE
jgi:hypothetical protein